MPSAKRLRVENEKVIHKTRIACWQVATKTIPMKEDDNFLCLKKFITHVSYITPETKRTIDICDWICEFFHTFDKLANKML